MPAIMDITDTPLQLVVMEATQALQVLKSQHQTSLAHALKTMGITLQQCNKTCGTSVLAMICRWWSSIVGVRPMQNAMGKLKEQGQAAEAMAALLSSALCEMLQKHQGNNSSAEIQLAQATLRLKRLLKKFEACQAAQLAAGHVLLGRHLEGMINIEQACVKPQHLAILHASWHMIRIRSQSPACLHGDAPALLAGGVAST